MNDLMIFSNEEFGEVRTVEINGKPYFMALDIARALGYARPADAISAHCKGSVKHRVLTNGGEQEAKFIPEGDIYRLLIKSQMPDAPRFESWVFDEVIPSIRKTGGYNLPQTYSEALRALADKAEEAERLALENAEMKPKAEFADAIIASSTTILVGEFAKILNQNGIETGQNRLFKWFVDNHYLIKRNGQYEPTQYAMELKLFEIDSKPIRIGDETQIKRTVRVTPKGQKYFINKLLAERNVA